MIEVVEDFLDVMFGWLLLVFEVCCKLFILFFVELDDDVKVLVLVFDDVVVSGGNGMVVLGDV